MRSKVLVAVSGGPDSILLLDKIRRNPFYIPIVAHLNYNLRSQSTEDYLLLKKYCGKYKIELHLKDIKESDWKKYQFQKNKQSIARQLRYDFFICLSNKYLINTIYIGHHRDDFIETAIMQEQRSKDYLFFGIKKVSTYRTLTIKRPLLKLYKEDIINLCKEKKISFSTDLTNFDPIYERNKLRIKLASKTKKEKQAIYNYYSKLNATNEVLRNKVEIKYKDWIEKGTKVSILSTEPHTMQKRLLYQFLILSEERININSNKLNGILEFLKNPINKGEYRLRSDLVLVINNDSIDIKKV